MQIVADENIPLLDEFFAGFGTLHRHPGRAIDRAALGDAEVLLVRSVTRVDRALLEGSKVRFVGTSAWFFFGINLLKIPFSTSLGLLAWADVWRALALAPLVGIGAWLGRHTIRRISQAAFEKAVLAASALSALALLVR